MQATTRRPRIVVATGGRGVASHVGSRLLADVADAAELTTALSAAAAVAGRRAGGHDPGRVLSDGAVMLADGGQTISDLGVLRDQPGLFGQVASTATAWRVLDSLDEHGLARLAEARADARERAWLLAAEAGRPVPKSRAGGRELGGLVIDLDATIVVCHSDKQDAAPTFKHTFGYHPLLAFLDNTGEALAGLLRPSGAPGVLRGGVEEPTDLEGRGWAGLRTGGQPRARCPGLVV